VGAAELTNILEVVRADVGVDNGDASVGDEIERIGRLFSIGYSYVRQYPY
jgi:hypothetical protein